MRATVCWNVAWMRPSAGSISASNPVPYVERSFSTARYRNSESMIGCCPWSFSSEAASVENPVFVRLFGARRSVSKSTVRSCGVEFTLKVTPASSWMRASSIVASVARRPLRARSSPASTPTPSVSIRASTRTRGRSIWS